VSAADFDDLLRSGAAMESRALVSDETLWATESVDDSEL
jgi:hypothetical protein